MSRKYLSKEEALALFSELPSDDESIISDGSTSDEEYVQPPDLSSSDEDTVEMEWEDEEEPDDMSRPGPSQPIEVTWITRGATKTVLPDFCAEAGPSEEILSLPEKNPISLFLALFTITLIEEIVFQTNLYATQEGKQFTPLSSECKQMHVQWIAVAGMGEYLRAVCVTGPPNSGKSFFFDCLISIVMNVGHIGRVNNKTNPFSLQDAVNRRVVVGNEISMEEAAKEDFKKLTEGTALNIRVKHKADHILTRTPVLLMSNNPLFVNYDEAFRDIRVKSFTWKRADFLKIYQKKPYPLCIFKVFQYFNVEFK